MMTTNVEQIVTMPVTNPDTKGVSRTFVFMGKVDRVETHKVVDWKGVGDIPRFIRQQKIGFQGELYAACLEAAGHRITEIEYRLICRPTIKYCEPKHTYACMKAGGKKAFKVCDIEAEAKKWIKLQGSSIVHRVKGDADRDAYEQRCVEWLGDPDHKVRIQSYPYFTTSSKLLQARWYLWESSKRLLENRRCNRWLPNTGACFAYERECPYADLCEALQNGADYEWVIGEQYAMQESSHPELEGADEGKDVLTYSSLSDLGRCELLYHWKHERKLRKGIDADTEPLWVGSALHAGLEAYAQVVSARALGRTYSAFTAIDEWADANPVIGEEAWRKQDAQIAKARAMVRAAVEKWPVA